MARSSRRSPDKRRIRDNVTYSISEVAQLLDKAESTVTEWLGKGLPTIDALEPTLVFGWQLKQWHQAWWASRKVPCGDTGFYCSPCRDRRIPKPGSIEVQPTNTRAFKALAVCPVCSAKMFRSVKAEKIAKLYAQEREVDYENGFSDSDISSTNGLLGQNTTDPANCAETNSKKRIARCLNPPQNPANERVKRDYYSHLKNACGLGDFTIEKRIIALLRYEAFTGWKPLNTFERQTALDYKANLFAIELQLQTRVAELKGLMHFFNWLIESRLMPVEFSALDVAYLRPTIAERNACRATKLMCFPEVPQALTAFRRMPCKSVTDFRDRAIFALLASTGIRIGALRTLRIKHFDTARRLVHQNPTEVGTKFRREIFSFILDVDKEFEDAIFDWVNKLRTDLGFGDEDPLFPRTELSQAQGKAFGERKLSNEFYESTQMLEHIIKQAFMNAGMPAYTPHRFRNMIVHEMYARELTPAQVRAWSQNLGHLTPKTSLVAYGRLTLEEQEAIIKKGSKAGDNRPLTKADLQEVVRELKKERDEG